MNVKDSIIVKEKLKGKNSKQIAKIVYPGSKNGDVSVRQRLQKPTLKAALNKALQRHNITIDRVLKPIDEALDATKVVITGKGEDAFAEVQPDHTTRMQASDRAVKLMGLDKVHDNPDNVKGVITDPATVKKAIEEGNTVTLTQAVFN